MLSISTDSIVDIFNLVSLFDLLNLRQTCIHVQKIISNNCFQHEISVSDKSDPIFRDRTYTKWINIPYIFKTFKFQNFVFDNTMPLPSIYKYYWKKCHTLDFSRCNTITDSDIKYLSKCHTIVMTFCKKITDYGVKYLGKCHRLSLTCCNLITDNGFKYLGRCSIIDLLGCKNIRCRAKIFRKMR